MKTAVIVIPTYNEAGNIKELLTSIFNQTAKLPNWNTQVLVVDSTSPDKTAEIVKKLQKEHRNLHIMETPKEGLGKAYTKGFKYAIDRLSAFVVMEMDADLSHDPKEIPAMLKAIEQGSDFVIGSRYIKGGSIPADWGIHRKLFSVVANMFVKYMFMKPQIHEWTSGYRAMKTWIVKEAFSHIENYTGYIFQIALLDFAIKKHARISEIPIHFKDRTAGESKISFGGYIFTIISYILGHSSFVKFVIVGLTGFVLDIGIFYVLTKYAHFVSWHANLISTETAVISNYILNNFWSFSHKKVEHKASAYFRSFLKYNFVSLGSILIQTLGVEFMKHLFGIQYLYLYKVGIIAFVIIPYSYFFFNKFIWKDKR